MTCIQEVVERWVARMTTDPGLNPLKIQRVYSEDNRIYSYGRHFQLGRALRDKQGDTELFLLNGDMVSTSTANHQRHLRRAVEDSGAPNVIVSFSALESAGIDRDSVRVLERSRDRWQEREFTSPAPPAGSQWRHGVLYRSPYRFAARVSIIDAEGGEPLYCWTERRHWLGESLIRAKITWSGSTPCRHCRGGRLQPEVPRWVSDAQWLAGRCGACNGGGGRNWRRSRTALFLSGFDANEPRPSYFFCELPPRCTATSIEGAYEALKPEVVRLAEQMGRAVARQGDIFAVPLSKLTTKRKLRAAGARFERRGALLGTNHVASEVAYLPDGTTVVRGVLHHVPRWRRPDHVKVRLAPGFHVVVKNTVPLSR